MRISHRHRFVFFANPKTGSSSVRQFLDPYSDVRPVKNYAARTEDNPFYPHARPVEVRDWFRRFGWDFDGYTKFVFVRNPWARVVSLYRHVRQADASAPDFPTWMRELRAEGPGGGGSPEARWRRHGAYSLRSFIDDEAGTPLVDEILRLEDIDTALKPFLAKLRLPELDARSIPHSNERGAGESHVSYHDEETRARVAELYRDEIERFGYGFEE